MNELAVSIFKLKALFHLTAHEAIVRRFFGFKRVAYLFSKEARRQRDLFNEAQTHLSKLDPECPPFRL